MKINPENGSVSLPDGNMISARTTLDDWIACFPKSSPNHLQAGITFFGLSFTKQSEQYISSWAMPLAPLKHRQQANTVDLHGAMRARITTNKTAVRE